ncbi:MAG: hypothetical protein JNL28_01785 [Planctomycetes bacterium]|nr:hypothetical protein [Planctomycetota bacterium]
MNRIDNLNTGRGTRAATILVPALLLILGMSGVVAKPTLGLETARRQRAEVEGREGEFERERLRRAEFESQGGSERLAQLRAAVTRVIPARMSALDLQNIVVLMARRHAIDVQTIEIGNALETDFEPIEDRILAVNVHARGVGTLGGFVNFVEGVQAAGVAACVLDCTLSRMQTDDPRFEFRITLSFHHRDTLLAAMDESQRGDA